LIVQKKKPAKFAGSRAEKINRGKRVETLYGEGLPGLTRLENQPPILILAESLDSASDTST
jgi:hypothetical protein